MRTNDALSYFESPEFKAVLERYEAARESGQAIYMDADDLTDLAEYYSLVCFDTRRAGEAIDLAIRLHPDATDPQLFKARQLMLEGDLEASRQMCDAVPDQSDREVAYLRAELLLRDGKNSEAVKLLTDMAPFVEDDPDYFLHDSADIFLDYDDFGSALVMAEKLEAMAPDWFKTWEIKADILLALERHEEALTYIEKMLDKDPFYVEAWNWRTEAYSALGNHEKTLESIDYALAITPSDERALQLKAWTLMHNGNPEQAHAIYQDLQRDFPDTEQHYLYDSYCLLDMGQREEALRMLEKAEEKAAGMSTEQMDIYQHHAHILSDMGMADEAIHYLDLAEKEQGNDELWADFAFMRLEVYTMNGYHNRALAIMDDVVRRDPSLRPLAFYHIGRAAAMATHYETARQMFGKLLSECAPCDQEADAHAYLAAVCHELEDHEAALHHLRLAVAQEAGCLQEAFGYILPQDTPVSDYFDFYFYQVRGHWPNGSAPAAK